MMEKEQENADVTPESASSEEDTANLREEEITNLRKELLLAKADLENMRKRMDRERTDLLKYGTFKFCQEILSVADGIENALYSLQDAQDHTTIIQGIEVIQKSLKNFFDKNGIKKFDSLDVPFDPQKHEAMFEVKDGNQDDNTVVQVIQDGYMMYDRVLRPARVGVKKSENS